MKTKLLSMLLTLTLVLSAFSFSVRDEGVKAATGVNILDYDSNTGSSSFEITSVSGLTKFSSLASKTDFSGKTVRLMCDIDMNGASYTPFTSFSGTFDGNYYSIRNIKIATKGINCGFIGTLTSKGVVKNLGIEGGYIEGKVSTDAERIGSIVGVVSGGTIDKCWSTATVVGAKINSTDTDDISVGGIAGGLLLGGTVKNSYFAGFVNGPKHAAGISDWCQGHYSGYVGTIINCFTWCTIDAPEQYALGRYSSGILEENKATAIQNSYYPNWQSKNYDWSKATPCTKGEMGSGALAYKLDNGNSSGRTRIWKQGSVFPEIAKGGNAGVYTLKITTKTSDGGSATATVYRTAGTKYTVKAGSATVSLSASSGTVSGNTYIMPASNATLNVTVNIPNLSSVASNSSANEFVVTNIGGLNALATFINGGKGTFSGKKIYMLHDIDMNSTSFTPIGVYISDQDWSKSFSGSFYGNDFRIYNINVNKPSLNGAGLFGSSYKAKFERLGVINGTVISYNRAGGISGYGDASTFSYCYNGADITTKGGVDGCGGLTGVSRSSTVFNYCYNMGNIIAEGNCAGGISGWGQTNVKLVGCYNIGYVYANSGAYTALARTASGHTPDYSTSYYLTNTQSQNGGNARDFKGMADPRVACSLNVGSDTSAYTNTPLFPAIRTENDTAATRKSVTALSEATGAFIRSEYVYGNVGDVVAMPEKGYYSVNTLILGTNSSVNVRETSYTISYETNGGVFATTPIKTYYSSKAVNLSENITKSGYAFMGWYLDSAMTSNPVSYIESSMTGAVKVYAKWGVEDVITSLAEFVTFANNVNNGVNYSGIVVRLGADIDLMNSSFAPIGTKSKPFTGVFDGNGYSIKNVNITSSGDNVGLFGYVKGGIVKNVFLEKGTVKGESNIGSLVGVNEGLVYNSISDANVVSASSATQIKIMSSNIRVQGDASPNTIPERAPRLQAQINRYSPDILGMQEVTSQWKPYLDTYLSAYSSEFRYRRATENEGAPLYWKTSKFTCLEKGTFWLSATPDVESIGWGAACYRTCSFAALVEKTTGRLILAFNTHLDHVSDEARLEGAKVVATRMKALEEKYKNMGYEDIAQCVMGDFNCHPNTSPHSAFTSFITNSSTVAENMISPASTNTFNGYASWTGKSIIDYVYVDDLDLDVISYQVCNENVYGGFVSDHFAVQTVVAFTEKATGGIVGRNKGRVINCAFTGTVKGDLAVGGLVGENYGKIHGGYSACAVSGDTICGAIAGINRNGGIKSFYVSDTLSGAYKVAGTKVTEERLKSEISLLGEYGSWKNVGLINSGYPIQSIMRKTGKITLKSTSSFKLENKIVSGAQVGQTKEAILENFENQGLTVEGNVATGSKVNLVVSGETVDSVTLAIWGDVDGNGAVDSTDYVKVKSVFLGATALSGAYLVAADTDGSGDLSSTDYLKIKSYFLELSA